MEKTGTQDAKLITYKVLGWDSTGRHLATIQSDPMPPKDFLDEWLDQKTLKAAVQEEVNKTHKNVVVHRVLGCIINLQQ